MDDNRDGKINYQEFTKVLTAEDIMHVAAPRSVNSSQLCMNRAEPAPVALAMP